MGWNAQFESDSKPMTRRLEFDPTILKGFTCIKLTVSFFRHKYVITRLRSTRSTKEYHLYVVIPFSFTNSNNEKTSTIFWMRNFRINCLRLLVSEENNFVVYKNIKYRNKNKTVLSSDKLISCCNCYNTMYNTTTPNTCI